MTTKHRLEAVQVMAAQNGATVDCNMSSIEDRYELTERDGFQSTYATLNDVVDELEGIDAETV